MTEHTTNEHAFLSTSALARTISPGQHAVIDYSVAGTFLAAGLGFLSRNRPAAMFAFANSAAITAMSMLTDYPGGVFRKLSFSTHRTADILLAALTAAGPALFRFADTPEASYFYGQAVAEAGVIAATDWDAA